MTASQDGDRRTPSEGLAREIADRLIDEGLVSAEKRGELERGLASGTLKTEDWRLLIEQAVGREQEP